MPGVTTLEDLDREIKSTDPDVLDILVSAADWQTLASHFGPFSFVMGTEDRPPFFWYGGRRILPRGPWRR